MRITVRQGRDARFSCIATGNPTPTILWHVNGLSRPGIITMSIYKTKKKRNLHPVFYNSYIFL